MSDQENYFNIDYPGYSPLEVLLNDPEDFLKVRALKIEACSK